MSSYDLGFTQIEEREEVVCKLHGNRVTSERQHGYPVVAAARIYVIDGLSEINQMEGNMCKAIVSVVSKKLSN